MSQYNTQNPVPSVDVRDLYDNAQNLDSLVNGPLPAYTDRLGVSRKSYKGMELDFSAFLAASGFELPALEYVDGSSLVVARPTQLIERDGFLYSVKATEEFPAALTGTWATDEARVALRADQALRQDLANNVDAAKGADLVGYRGRTVRENLDDYVNVKDHGAAGDGVSDDTPAIVSAIASGKGAVYFPAGTYRTTATIVISSPSTSIIGAGRNKTWIAADFRGGAVLQVENSRCSIMDIGIESLAGSARIAASPLGKIAPDSTVDGKSTDHGIVLKQGVNPFTYTNISRVDIVNQPACGIAMFGAGYGSIIEQAAITQNGGHGIYADNGGMLGMTLTRNGICDITSCVIQKSWGDGIAIGVLGPNTCFRYRLINNDLFDNALGDGGVNQPSYLDSTGAEIEARCEQLTIDTCAVGGNENGINISASNAIILHNIRFISISDRGVLLNPNCSNVSIQNMSSFTLLPSVGFRIQSGCQNVEIAGVFSNQWGTLVDAESEVRLLVGNQNAKTVPGSNNLFFESGIQSFTISSGAVDVRGNKVALTGEGDTADTVSSFRFDASASVPNWYTFTVFNFRSYNITIGDRTVLGTGNIELRGTNAVLEPGESLTLIANGGVYYAIGRGVS